MKTTTKVGGYVFLRERTVFLQQTNNERADLGATVVCHVLWMHRLPSDGLDNASLPGLGAALTRPALYTPFLHARSQAEWGIFSAQGFGLFRFSKLQLGLFGDVLQVGHQFTIFRFEFVFNAGLLCFQQSVVFIAALVFDLPQVLKGTSRSGFEFLDGGHAVASLRSTIAAFLAIR